MQRLGAAVGQMRARGFGPWWPQSCWGPYNPQRADRAQDDSGALGCHHETAARRVPAGALFHLRGLSLNGHMGRV